MDLRRYTVRSAAFGGDRAVSVLLPDGYARRRRRYPVLYLHDGTHDWLGRGDLVGALQEAGCDDLLVVLPEPVDRTREYKLSSAHLAFMADELAPWADATLRTRAEPRHRAVHGVSLGGLAAIALGLRRSDLFGTAGGQGGAYWYWKQRVVREAARSRGCPTRFHVTCGRLDGNLPDNRALRDALAAAGLAHHYEEVAGRHSWACWRRTLPAALRWYFG